MSTNMATRDKFNMANLPIFSRIRPIYFMITAWLVGVLGPFVWMFFTSITPDRDLLTQAKDVFPKHTTFAAYQHMLNDSRFIKYMFNSLTVAISTVTLTTLIALLAGTALSRYRFRGHSFILMSILLVQLFPSILLIVPLYIELKKMGLLNTKLGLVLVYTSFSLSFATWLLKGFIDQIPKEIEESMTVDGASKIQVFRYLIFPPARPGIAAAGTYAFIYSWNEFIFSLTFTNGQGARTLPVGIQQFIAEDLIRWDLITASGVMAAIPILIGFMFAQRVLISGLTAGAVKG